MIKTYFELTKPSMVAANMLVAIAAFVFGSHGHIDWLTFSLLLFGLSWIIASACVFNNIYDSEIDAKMERTKGRVLARGGFKKTRALIFGIALFAEGMFLLWHTNVIAFSAGLVGFIFYVAFYTPLKHRSALALYVGAVAGATPAVAGYTAATGTLDIYAWSFFIFMFIWQLPHFLAIAKYRYEEYTTAGIPLLVAQPSTESARKKARTIFFSSLVVLLIACALIAAVPYV